MRFEAWRDHSENTLSCEEGNRKGDKERDWQSRVSRGVIGGQRCIDVWHGGRAGDLWRWRVAMLSRRPRFVASQCRWTLTGMWRLLSTIQITDALQGVDEGRALGLPNPGSSLFHVPRLPTMLSRISRQSLSANLKPACYTKGIRPGSNRMSNLLSLTDTSWFHSTVVNTVLLWYHLSHLLLLLLFFNLYQIFQTSFKFRYPSTLLHICCSFH